MNSITCAWRKGRNFFFVKTQNDSLFKRRFKYYTSHNWTERVQFGYNNRFGTRMGKPDDALPFPLVGVANRYATRIGKLEMSQHCGSPPPTARWIEHPVLASKRSAASNFGHLLGECVIPAYMLMSAFGEDGEWITDDSEIQFLFLDDCYDESEQESAFLTGKKFQDKCASMSTEVFGFLSKRPILLRKNMMEETVCFKRLLAGTEPYMMMMGPLSMWDGNDGGRGLFFRKWRDFVWKKNSFPKYRKVEKKEFVMTISAKSGVSFNSRDFVNLKETVDFLKHGYTEFNGKNVRLNVLMPGETSFQEEISILSDTDVWIVPGGATHISAMFLPRGSTLLTFPLCSDFSNNKGACSTVAGHMRQCVCKNHVCCFVDDEWFHTYIPANLVIYETDVEKDVIGACRCGGPLMKCEDCGISIDLERLKKSIDRALVYTSVFRQTHQNWKVQLF